MSNKIIRWFRTFNYPSYIVFFVTARCNANCKMCFYKGNMLSGQKNKELTLDEYEKISRRIKLINVLGISGGEPFLRNDLAEIVKIIYKNCSPLVVDLPTNGFFVESVIKQTEDIARYCKNMVIDLQLSIDGPENIHNEIRGLKDSFKRVKECYEALVAIKNRYRNLRLKACVVYSHYNQEYIESLFDILRTEFKDLDRVVFSVVHGSVTNLEAVQFDWLRYFEICDRIRANSTVKNILDFHSVFTIALRIAKNEFLKEVLRKRDMYKKCGAGKRVIIISETGKVFPCEPLWQEVGDLRGNDYNLDKIVNSKEMEEFKQKIINQSCNCHWGLPMSNAILYKPEYYPFVFREAIKIIGRSMLNKDKTMVCH